MRSIARALGALSVALCSACSCDGDDPAAGGADGTGARSGGGAALGGSGASETGAGGGGGGSAGPKARLYLALGGDLPPAVAARIEAHVVSTSPLPVEQLEGGALPPEGEDGSVVLAFGDTAATHAVIAPDEVAALPDEGFIVRTGDVAGTRAIAAAGATVGSAYGAYAALEHLGFAFLHPLEPTVPSSLDVGFEDLDATETPRWPIRGLQIHTMHPLELTNLLEGWGPNEPEDEAGFEAMLPDWDRALEWAVANRQNRLQWVLLWAESWGDFGDSEERQSRLLALTTRAHEFAIEVGIDTPLRQQQQQSFRLIREDGTLEEELAQIRARVDWLMGAGFDYMTTEMGSTEFTSTDDTRTVAWMDELARYLDEAYGKRAAVKVHASTGQTVDHYLDPETGEPLNYNFLPHYADARLGVLPHTVQHYGIDDPSPTYGNGDFGYMRQFLQEEVGLRQVLWHPETAYWVSFDVDVPLFLPVYAERRLHDLRLLVGDEDQGRMGRGPHAGEHMNGQLTFSSGWEWGAWIQEVTTARAAWSPPDPSMSDEAALRGALVPITRAFGPAAGGMEDALVELAQAQRELLIEGRVNGVAPNDIVRRNGQAYMQGFETWDDLSQLGESLPNSHFTLTQPERLGLLEMRNPLHAAPGYSAEVEPLLAEMETRFSAIADQIEGLAPAIPAEALPLYRDIADGARVLALRATQVHGLYDYVDAIYDWSPTFRQMRLATARDALDQALVITAAHETNYRVDPDRIAAWRHNPTAYEFGYLWTARTLFYWWRDEALAVQAPLNPCFMNIIDPAKLALGEGSLSSAASLLDQALGGMSATECVAAPASEPELPPPGLRP